MSFWDELSPAVKRYMVVAVVLVGVLLGLRACMTPSAGGGHVPPRGLSR